MTSLGDIQAMVSDAVFESPVDGPALTAISEYLTASPGIPAAEHLRIYRRAILGTLVRGLGNLYPVCKRVLGEQFFDAMARLYARKTPSRSPDLAEYGDNFCRFIETFEPAAELAYLPDIASLEWCWHRAYHASDEAGLDHEALSRIPAADRGRIMFRLPASASLIASEFPIHRIWEVNQDDWTGDQAIDLDAGPVRLIVWRRHYDMRIDELDKPSWQLLTAVDQATRFDALCKSTHFEDLDVILPQCVQHGWIAGFELD